MRYSPSTSENDECCKIRLLSMYSSSTKEGSDLGQEFLPLVPQAVLRTFEFSAYNLRKIVYVYTMFFWRERVHNLKTDKIVKEPLIGWGASPERIPQS